MEEIRQRGEAGRAVDGHVPADCSQGEATWPRELKAAIAHTFPGQKKQGRPLTLVTGFTGLGSQSRVFKDIVRT